MAGSSTEGSGRISTLSGTLCTAAMQPEWMLPPRAPLLGPAPSRAPWLAPVLPSDPARRPIVPPPMAAPPPQGFNPAGPYHSARASGGPGPGRLWAPAPRCSGTVSAPSNPTSARLAGLCRTGAGLRLSAGRRLAASPPRVASREWKLPDRLPHGESAGRGAGERG